MRFFSLLVVVVLAIGLMPLPAFAGEGGDDSTTGLIAVTWVLSNDDGEGDDEFDEPTDDEEEAFNAAKLAAEQKASVKGAL